jgi:hypothetical protein
MLFEEELLLLLLLLLPGFEAVLPPVVEVVTGFVATGAGTTATGAVGAALEGGGTAPEEPLDFIFCCAKAKAGSNADIATKYLSFICFSY